MQIGKPAAFGFILLLSCCLSNAQSFESASIRPSLNGSEDAGIVNLLPGGRIRVAHATLKTLIRNAWEIQSFQLAGEKSWIDSDFYDIEAVTGSGADLSQDQMKVYLQNLLADRFHLKVHWETREGNVYALEADKSRLKMKENLTGKDPTFNVEKNSGQIRIKGEAVPIALLAASLENQLRTPVLDKTGLAGAWDFQGSWDMNPAPDSSTPSIFTALRDQLGLRLVSQKGPVRMLVIDQVEKPSEN